MHCGGDESMVFPVIVMKVNWLFDESAIRRRSPDPEKPHLLDLDIQFGKGGKPSQMTCTQGQKVAVHTTHQQRGYVACFELSVCQECPLLKEGKCLAQAGKRNELLRVRFTQVEASAGIPTPEA